MSYLDQLEQLANNASKGAWRVASGGSDIEVVYSANGRAYSDGIAGHLLDGDAAYIVAAQPVHMLALIERVRAAEARERHTAQTLALVAKQAIRFQTDRIPNANRFERALNVARGDVGEAVIQLITERASK